MAKKKSQSQLNDSSAAATPAPAQVGKPRRTRAQGKGSDTQASTAAETSTSATIVERPAAQGVSGSPGSLDTPVSQSRPGSPGTNDRYSMDPSGSAWRSVSMSPEPSEEAIRIRAYHRYLERGGGDGMQFADWLEAERELKTR